MVARRPLNDEQRCRRAAAAHVKVVTLRRSHEERRCLELDNFGKRAKLTPRNGSLTGKIGFLAVAISGAAEVIKRTASFVTTASENCNRSCAEASV